MVTLHEAPSGSTTQLSLSLSHHCSANEGLKGQSATTKGTLWEQGVHISDCEEETSLLNSNVSWCVTAVNLPARTPQKSDLYTVTKRLWL